MRESVTERSGARAPKYGKWHQFEDWMGMNVERITFEQRIGW